MKKFFKASLLSISFLISLTGCSKTTERPLSATKFFLGTVCTIDLYDNKSEEILGIAFKRIEELDGMLSANSDNSEVARINQNSGQVKTHVSSETYEVIKKGLEFSVDSYGAFDITIGSLTSLWRIGSPEARVPEQSEIDNVLNLVNYKEVEVDESDKSVYLKNSGMKLDLGGIAKGFIVDETAKVLIENGVSGAVINLGGDIFMLGSINDTDWSVGVQEPNSNDIVGFIKCRDKAVVTSGIYERFAVKDGVRFHHILNPDNGYPFNNQITSVTIVSESTATADALSTIAFAMGLDDGLEFMESVEDAEALFITDNNEIFLTSGLKDIFTLTNDLFVTYCFEY